ncbi:Hypothetical protein, putative [Bodo saltans]|uniref:Uncharacterized protein n=1 Tax=Bodo saltans TaxID=75058 RepID=A0A0S4IVH6_BODSA|nr:Hypothetical protein, putative [Bodo saltans]|eukprot:CUG03870.1 Hypothetical protein, putative [Bodo saltans]
MMTSTSLSYRSATTHVKDEPWKASHLTTQKSSLTIGAFITNEDEQQRQAAVDREEANEFFPLPPSGSKLGDLLLSSDDDTSQSCSNASTPPPQSLGDALQRSFKFFHADEAETSRPPSTVDTQRHASRTTESSSWESPSPKPLLPSTVDATLAHRRGYPVAIQQLIVPSPNCAQGLGHHRNDPPSPTSVLPAIPLPLSNVILATPASTEPYDHQHSNALDIIELFASCNVDIATTTIAPSAAPPQEDHASHLCATDTVAQRGTDEIPSSLNEQAVDGNALVAPLLASSPPITQPRAVTPPTPVTAAMQDVLRNTEVFDWFELDDDDEADEASTTQPHHQQHDQQSYPQLDWVASIPSVQEVGLDALVSYVPSMMGLESRTFCGDSPQHSMSMRHTQGTTSPVVSIISTSFHGALAKFQFPPTTEDTPLDEMIIKPIVRQRSQVIVRPQAVVVQRHARHEVATQTTTPRVTQSKESDSTTTTSLTSPMVKINRALSPATLSLRSLPSRYLSSSSSSSPSTSSSEDGHDSPTPIQPSEGSDDSRAAPVKATSPSPSVDSLASAATTPVPMEQLPSTTALVPRHF